MWTRALFALTVGGCSLTLLGYQGSVSVFDCISGRPIPEATVLFSREDGTTLETETNPDGQATFAGLRPGVYWIRVEASGYADLLDPHARGRLAVISPATKYPIGIGLTRTAAISGQVSDVQGRPLQGAEVTAVVRRGINGSSRLTPFGEAVPTDDRGGYRLHGLPPGHYSVAVLPTREASGFAPVRETAFFELKPGETRTSVDLTVASPEGSSIIGKVSGIPADAKPNRAAVALATRGALGVTIAAVLTDADGAFIISGVPRGEHQITAWTPFAGWDSRAQPARAGARSAVQSVSVSGAGLQVDLELRPLVNISGRLVWDGNPRVYPCTGARQIAFRSEDGWLDVWAPAVAVNGDRVTVVGLPVGRYRVEMPGLGDSCRLAAVRVGNEAAPGGIAPIDGSAPLTLVLATATGEVSGSITAEDAKPAVGIVILSSADGDGAVQMAQADGEGRYRFSKVLAGAYHLIALDRLSSTDYLDPVEASALGAKLVVVEAGQKVTFDLRLMPQ